MEIIAGLFIGNQVGVFGFSYLAIKFGYSTLPSGSNMMQLYGLSVLTGTGFTMSLFVDSLAFTDSSLYQYADKLVIIIASVLSGVIGYLILRNTASHSHLRRRVFLFHFLRLKKERKSERCLLLKKY